MKNKIYDILITLAEWSLLVVFMCGFPVLCLATLGGGK